MNKKGIPILLLLIAVPQISLSQDTFEITVYNASDYTIGIGSCGEPCKKYKKISPNQKASVNIPKTHRELMIERYSDGADPVGYRITEDLQKMSSSVTLVFVPHYTMAFILNSDFGKIDLKDKKSVTAVSKGRLELLD